MLSQSSGWSGALLAVGGERKSSGCYSNTKGRHKEGKCSSRQQQLTLDRRASAISGVAQADSGRTTTTSNRDRRGAERRDATKGRTPIDPLHVSLTANAVPARAAAAFAAAAASGVSTDACAAAKTEQRLFRVQTIPAYEGDGSKRDTQTQRKGDT